MRAEYGIDSPGIVSFLVIAGLVCVGAAREIGSAWKWLPWGFGIYFLLGAVGMLFYSTVGKYRLRERLLDRIPWQGGELVLDLGCGRGLLAVGAARRLTTGRVVGLDPWKGGGLSGNQPESVLENARREGVPGRVSVERGDARHLPFADGSFDVVVSNFVLHEMKSRDERASMIREIARVLKPGGRVALVDFIFTAECVETLTKSGVPSQRFRDPTPSFWFSVVLNAGMVRTYHVLGTKLPDMAE
jgi:ubiquinone/menaquinone biosynthesis C-methylase UbiE